MIIKLKISDLIIDFDTRYPEYMRRRCEGYVVENEVTDLTLRATEEDIQLANRDNVGLQEAELYAMTIPLSEKLPELRRLMTHGVAVAYRGRSYMFTAESGVGKSTHAFMWQKCLDEEQVRVINGDKPIVWFREDGVYATGSPWSGKERLDENVALPLGGICLLRRLGNEPRPRIYRATKEEALDFLMHQVFIPYSPMGKVLTLKMLEELYHRVPVYHLVTDISEEGVKIATKELL